MNISEIRRRDFLTSIAAAFLMPLLRLRAFGQSRSLADDHQRPQFHLLPAHNWMNDPNGPIFVNGRYHMFFQYNPQGATWGNMSWNHAVSPDMIHWTHQPLAITPTVGSPDAYGCFSGSAIAVQEDGKTRVYFVYTGTVKSTTAPTIKAEGIQESQCLAWSDDPNLTHWTKQPAPIVPAPPATLATTGFRDPSAWRQGDWYYMTVGSGIAKLGGCVLLYRSRDMHQWKYLHPLVTGKWTGHPAQNPCDNGEMWECPEFFPLDGSTHATHVLIYSTMGKVFWQSGLLDLSAMLFQPLKSGLIDLDAFYAPKTQLDAHGRRILWGWVQERRSDADMRSAGWSGVMSLPRVLTLTPDGTLSMSFLPELASLRGGTISQDESRAGILRTIQKVTGELLLDSSPNAANFKLTLSIGKDQHLCQVSYSEDNNSFAIDDKLFPLLPGDRPTIHAYVDGSVLELILASRYSCTKRFYFAGESAPDLLAWLSPAGTSTMRAWTIHPISSNRLTTPALNQS